MERTCLSLWIFCLSGFLATAQSNELALKLTGIISLPDFEVALLESPGPPRGEGLVTLAESERRGRIEMLAIKTQAGLVEVSEGGMKVELELEKPATEVPETTGSNLRLNNVKLQQVLDVYARISGRTVLQHPALKAAVVSLNASALSRMEAAAALEKLFQRQGLASIPDQEKFVIIIPSQLTNGVAAKPSGIVPKTTDSTPIHTGTIHFENADLSQALAVYARLVDRKLVRTEGLRTASIRLITVNDVTRAEAAYALETLFRWNGVTIVQVGDLEFEAVPASSKRNSRRN